jgi:hypothetical protein
VILYQVELKIKETDGFRSFQEKVMLVFKVFLKALATWRRKSASKTEVHGLHRQDVRFRVLYISMLLFGTYAIV